MLMNISFAAYSYYYFYFTVESNSDLCCNS